MYIMPFNGLLSPVAEEQPGGSHASRPEVRCDQIKQNERTLYSKGAPQIVTFAVVE